MVPKGLRTWFVIHFMVDVLFAVPLLLVPVFFLTRLGWTTVDPFITRLVGAALLGIGVESFLGRDADVEVYRGMLNLKIVWSSSAIFGILLTLATIGGPILTWLILAIFLVFNVVWVNYRLRLQ